MGVVIIGEVLVNFPYPRLFELDWMLFLAGHLAHHVGQLEQRGFAPAGKMKYIVLRFFTDQGTMDTIAQITGVDVITRRAAIALNDHRLIGIDALQKLVDDTDLVVGIGSVNIGKTSANGIQTIRMRKRETIGLAA